MTLISNSFFLGSCLSLICAIIIFSPILHFGKISLGFTFWIMTCFIINIATVSVLTDFQNTNNILSTKAYNNLKLLTDNQYNLTVSGWQSAYITHPYSFNKQTDWKQLSLKEVS